MGGLEYMGRTIVLSCDVTLAAACGVRHTAVSAPMRSAAIRNSQHTALARSLSTQRTIQTKVLAVALGCEQLEAAAHKQADGIAVGLDVAGGKALVRTVEEREQTAGLADVRNARPLLASRVHAGGVVCAQVEQNDGTAWCALLVLLALRLKAGTNQTNQQIRAHRVEVQSARLRLVVAVSLNGNASMSADLMVVTPTNSHQ